MFLEMSQVIDLVSLYTEVNQTIIDKRIERTNRYFRRVTDIL